jgi:hypothetical protein
MVEFPTGARDFSLLHIIHTSSGTYPASIQWALGALSLGIKQKEHEAEHSPPSSLEVKNSGVIPPIPHMPSRHGA